MTKDQFNEIVQQWYDPLYRFAYSLCRNPDDALDLTQNAFHKLARKGSAIRDLSKVKPWLFKALHREFIDGYRHDRRFPTTSLELVATPLDPKEASLSDSLDAADALRCLQELEPRFRAPLTLFYLKSFSYKEIAQSLDIPIGTVMSRLRRAKDQLRVLLETQARPNDLNASLPFSQKASNG